MTDCDGLGGGSSDRDVVNEGPRYSAKNLSLCDFWSPAVVTTESLEVLTLTVSDAAAAGDRPGTLRAMALNLAARLDDPEERGAAAVARELRLILDALAEGPAEEADFIDELRARRSNTTGVVVAAKGRKSRG